MGRGGAGMTLSIPTPRPVVDPPKFVCKEWGKDSPQGSGSSRGNSVGEYPCLPIFIKKKILPTPSTFLMNSKFSDSFEVDPHLALTLGLNGHL